MGGSLIVLLGLFGLAALAGLGGDGGSDADGPTDVTDLNDDTFSNGDDTFNGGSGADIIDAGAGDDLVATNGGNDNVRLGGGDDIWSDNDIALVLDPNQIGNLPETGDDTVSGGAGDDELVSLSGSDSLWGGSGDDDMLAVDIDYDNGPLPDAADTLGGGNGDDTLRGDDGDVMTGGAGEDEFHILLTQDPTRSDDASTDTAVQVTDFNPDEDTLVVNLVGGIGFDADEIATFPDPETGDLLLFADGITFARLTGVSEEDLDRFDINVIIA